MAEYVFSADQIGRFTDKLYFQGTNTLHDNQLLNARITIAELLLLERNPDNVTLVLAALRKLAVQPDLHVIFEVGPGRIEQVHIQEIIDSTREVQSGISDIAELMLKLKAAFRL